jgi:hypothetical protein
VAETVQSTAALTALGIIALVLLAGIVLYLLMSASRRRKAPPQLLPDHSAETRRANDGLTHADALSARHAAERPTEDDMQAATLGPRGEPGKTSPATMTPQRAKKTPRHLEPGHTS